MHLFLLSKNDRCFLLTIARSNGVTIKDLNRLKTNTLVSVTVSSGTGQLGIDYLTAQVKLVYRRDTTPFGTGFYQILYETPLAHSLFPKMKVDFKKQNIRTFKIFYESTGLTEANFLHPLAKLCIQDAGRTPKKITDIFIKYMYRSSSV